MANLSDSQKRFIQDIAYYVSEFAPLYGIEVNSPIIAQAVLESAFGTSDLAKHHNYFGLKTRSKWTGNVYNKDTKEEYRPGTITTVNANFRAYPNMSDGVMGYFVFLFEPEAYGRYDNLKGITDPLLYAETIKADGYATDSKYVDKIMQCIYDYDLTIYDKHNTESDGYSVDIIRKIVAPGHGKFDSPNPIYFAVHSTANPGTSAYNHTVYWSRPQSQNGGQEYAVHFVSDWKEAYQCVELTNKCWQVGNGNYTCIGLEICEATNEADFMRGLEIARSVILQTLEKYGWDIDGHVRSHKWFTENYGGSDHTDPIPYFKKFGWTWDRFIDYLKEGDMPSASEIAKAVNEYRWGDKPVGQMIMETNKEVLRTDDVTGRGKDMTDHEHIKWIAKVQQDTLEAVNETNSLLKQLIEKM